VIAFVYGGLPARVLFGDGTLAQLSEEIAKLGAMRVLVISTPHQAAQAEHVAGLLTDKSAGICTLATMHTPTSVTEQALAIVRDRKVDALVAVGGGSTIGLAKAIALRTDLPIVAIPTTFAGSEMTPILGETGGGVKTTQKSPKVLPKVVIYDVALTLTLPPALCGVSGLNAIAHAVEALYAQDRNPVIDLLALESIAALARSLPRIAADAEDREARSDALYGAFLGGACLGAVGMALHHKLCHTLGGSFGLPHAETHAIVLPHALAYNAPAIENVMDRIEKALATRDAPQALYDLGAQVHAPRGLKDLGMPESSIDKATDLALANTYWNPRPLERAPLRALLAAAWAGTSPNASK